MKNAFAIVTLAALLSACTLPVRQAAPAPLAVPAAAASEPEPVLADSGEAPADAPAAEERLPHVALTSDLLYKLMKAEIEFRNGRWQAPYLTMMAAAQQTRDPRLAQRAASVCSPCLADNLAEAETIFSRRLQQAAPAERGLAMFQVQQFLARAKDKAAAAAMLERLLAPYAGTVEAHVVLAQSAFSRGAAELALQHARAALAVSYTHLTLPTNREV